MAILSCEGHCERAVLVIPRPDNRRGKRLELCGRERQRSNSIRPARVGHTEGVITQLPSGNTGQEEGRSGLANERNAIEAPLISYRSCTASCDRQRYIGA